MHEDHNVLETRHRVRTDFARKHLVPAMRAAHRPPPKLEHMSAKGRQLDRGRATCQIQSGPARVDLQEFVLLPSTIPRPPSWPHLHSATPSNRLICNGFCPMSGFAPRPRPLRSRAARCARQRPQCTSSCLGRRNHNPPQRSQYFNSTEFSSCLIMPMKFMSASPRMKLSLRELREFENLSIAFRRKQKSPGADCSAQGSFLLR